MEKTELKHRRKHLGLTQEELGRKLRVPSRTLQHYEGGTRRIPDILITALEKVESDAKTNQKRNV